MSAHTSVGRYIMYIVNCEKRRHFSRTVLSRLNGNFTVSWNFFFGDIPPRHLNESGKLLINSPRKYTLNILFNSKYYADRRIKLCNNITCTVIKMLFYVTIELCTNLQTCLYYYESSAERFKIIIESTMISKWVLYVSTERSGYF